MEEVRTVIESEYRASLKEAGVSTMPEISDDLVLLQSGLDSLGFAILITRLEQALDYDPFTLMEEAVYPSTFGEFVAIYERFAPKA